jgi:hypothetical protein
VQFDAEEIWAEGGYSVAAVREVSERRAVVVLHVDSIKITMRVAVVYLAISASSMHRHPSLGERMVEGVMDVGMPLSCCIMRPVASRRVA